MEIKQLKDYTLKPSVDGTEDILIQDNGVTKRVKTETILDAVDFSNYPTTQEMNTELNKKANQTYVNTELNKKANKTDVSKTITETVENIETKLLKKADTTDVNVELDLKANKTELHSHTNKTVLDGITSTNITNWNTAYNHSQTEHAPSNANKNVQVDWNNTDVNSDAYIKNKPNIPSKVSELINDSGFINEIPSEYITETELVAKNYATKTEIESQSFATESYVDDQILQAQLGAGVDLSSLISVSSNIVSDCNEWLTNGYTKTNNSTLNLPSECTDNSVYGILFFVTEDETQGTGIQMYFPVDGEYKGRMFVRSLKNMKQSGNEVIGLWSLIPTMDDVKKDELITNNVSNQTLTLTTDKYQTATLSNGDSIVLPSVTNFTEIHLFFKASSDLTLTIHSCKWQTVPNIKSNRTYEMIFTYVVDEWLGGIVEYE